jgi:hypothetical protein
MFGSLKKIVFVLLVFISACKSSPEPGERKVARVYDTYLYVKDLDGKLPANISKADSAILMNQYIETWVRQQLLIKQSDKNLSEEDKDFTKQLEDYKNSLLIYKYETQLIKQNLDTTLTDKEIADYYERNKSNFELKENIVKVIYVKIPRSVPMTIPKLYIGSDKPADRKKLQDFCVKYAVNYYLDDQNWLLFNDILKEIPINTYNQEEYLKNNRIIEIQDSSFSYLLNIKGFMIKEGISPLSFEEKNIREIIINKRKLKLIDDMEKDVYKNAVKKGAFEIMKK